MTLRNLTMQESFPLAYQQDLLKKQSEHFVNKSIAHGAFERGYENLPTELNSDTNLPLSLDSNPPRLLIGTYVKNHWRVILASIVVGGVIWYVIDNQIKKSNRKKRLHN
ncbi:hypothetical protein [Flavobacterium alvei]|uniref:hypothetical protein n=1 Tax=Flavobacterium alvei TaxID=2080416 RepID=UPI0026ECF0EF|nr:hypothetical protein [Flavobacterium alvei]